MRNYLNVDDVCVILKTNKDTVYKLFHVKGFPKIQIGKKYMVEENDLYAFLDNYKKSKIILN